MKKLLISSDINFDETKFFNGEVDSYNKEFDELASNMLLGELNYYLLKEFPLKLPCHINRKKESQTKFSKIQKSDNLMG